MYYSVAVSNIILMMNLAVGPIAGTSKRWIVHCADCRKRELDKLLESLTVDETSDQ